MRHPLAPARDFFYRRLERLVVAAFALTVAATIAAAFGYASAERRERLAAAREQAGTLTRALDEHARRTFGAIDLALEAVAADATSAGGLDSAASRRALRRDLERKRALLPQIRWFGVYDADLDLAAETSDGAGVRDAPGLRVALRDQRNGAAGGLLVGRPLGDARPAIPVTRRIVGADGRFAGVVAAVLDTEHFADFYRELRLAPAQSLFVARRDTTLLFRHPPLPWLPPGSEMSSAAPVLASPQEPGATARATVTPELDGRQRLLTWRVLDAPPLIVGVAHETQPLLAPWRIRVAGLTVGVAGIVVVLTLLVCIAVVQIRRRADAERRHRETLEQKVRERTAELESANEELRAFTYSASHDLRGPLTGVHGVLRLIQTKHGDEMPARALEILGHAEASVGNIVSLTEDLLTLSGVGRREMDRRPIDLGAIAREIGQRLNAESPQAVALDVAAGLVAVADAGLMRIALQNLLANAWKYSSRSASPRVEVFADEVDGERVFVVRDNGAGFDAAHAHRLFQPFQRLHSSRDFPGTGIGLATVARVVRRHGGRVWADGAPGRGASFRFTLPDPGEAPARP